MKNPVKRTASQNKTVSIDSVPDKTNYGLLFLVLLSVLFYFNTCFNEYALDDFLVISKNTYTQQGIAGIPDLVTKPSYYGFFKSNEEEAALRYRPLVMITYALECQFFKNKTILLFVSHLMNVLIFAFTVFVLYKLLNEYLFKANKSLAFITVLLFLIHPIHTESVANIKGRDELLAFLFAILSAWYLFRYIGDSKPVTYILSVIYFLAGLFCKENTISFLLVFPLMLYFFAALGMSSILKKMLPYLLVAGGYILIRFSVTGWSHAPSSELLNNPFLNAATEEKYATIILSMGYYLRLLFFPHPLSYDYTLNQIRLVTFSNIWVWFSLLVHLCLLAIAVIGWRRKTVVSFGIFFYFSTVFLVTNVVVNLGAFIGERLIYIPSLGFCMVVAYVLHVLFALADKTGFVSGKYIAYPVMALLILVAGAKTISRNADWENNLTLMMKDVQASPESMKANDACAVTMILATDDPGLSEERRKEFLYRAIQYDHKASEIMPSFTDVYMNLGAAFSRLEQPDSAEYFWNIARQQKPAHPKFREYDPVLGQLFLTRGLKLAVNKDMNGCIADLRKAVQYDSLNAEAWYNYGGALFSVGIVEEAKKAFVKTLEINPSHQQAQLGLSSSGSKN